MRTPRMTSALVLVAALLGESAVFAAMTNKSRGLEPFDIKKSPQTADWRYFIKASEPERERLWTYHEGRGVGLGQWAWGWRLGWVRVCGASERPICQKILGAALFDKALVVRAEAATRFGRRYEGTADDAIVSLLAKAYRNPRNVRNGKPLFVQQRILFALHRVGGERARSEAAALAAGNAESKSYWARLDGGS